MAGANDFFSRLPPFGPEKQSLIDMLRSPAVAYPDSLPGQLRFMREKWGLLLGKYFERLLAGLDLIKEEEKTFFPVRVRPRFLRRNRNGENAAGAEKEKFSSDRDWMPNLVLMAKTVYVWLDQLGKKYGRPIATLEQIPDEELDTLARWGFNGLWLIGVWERSPASRRIKQKCGNPEAMASAYSLFRYEIAADLGGEKALQNLKQRAGARGIRLASDMVPNHMGIDSPWVVRTPRMVRFTGPKSISGLHLLRRRYFQRSAGEPSISKTITTTAAMPRWYSNGWTAQTGRCTTSITATTARACPGTIRPN